LLVKEAAWMGCPLSIDLRSRLLAAIDKVLSSRAEARFDVVASTAIRWHARQGDMSAFGGDVRSRRLEGRAAEVLSI
jgi:hypothetical protein